MTAAAHSWLPAVGFLAAFAASRALAAACGLAFCSEHAAQIMHFPELELLRDRLFETAWHLHGQPPGPSLVLGALLKLAGMQLAHTSSVSAALIVFIHLDH